MVVDSMTFATLATFVTLTEVSLLGSYPIGPTFIPRR